MHYHVARDGQQLGRVPESDLRAGFSDGHYLATDLVWREGMAQWTPLGEVIKQSEPAPGSSPAPAAARAPGPAPAPAFAGRSPSARTAPASHGFPASPPSSGLPMTALISGILSFFLCGLGGIGTLVAIICGHKALSQINRSGGAMGGRGMALTGLILGYVSIFSTLTGVAIGASVTLPVFAQIQEKGNATKQIRHARDLILACKIYAADNNGRFPDTLEQLVEKNVLDAAKLEELNGFKVPTWDGEPGFEYLGAGKNDTALAETEILVSKAKSRRGETVIACYDGSARLVKPTERSE